MTILVSMEGITKTFSGVPALRDISFDIRAGEVQALLGENGAGKSTLMKILSGAYEPTSGSIVIDGTPHERLTTKESQDAGIGIIYQELSMINQLTIAENIFVGRLPGGRMMGMGVLDKRALRDRTRELLAEVGLNREPDTIVGHLSISEKQMVEIAKAIAFDCRIIVMDEPTSSLTEEEVDRLFQIVRALRDKGTAVVYISHKLKEVMALAQRVTVLKDGVAMATQNIEDVTIDSLVQLMVGRELKDKYLSEHGSQHHATGPTILEVSDLTRRDGRVRNVSFSLKKGEILGFSGLVGAGRSELMAAIYGAAPKRSGEVKLHGKTLNIRTPYDGLKNGISLVTEDRRGTGIFGNFSIRRNIAIGAQLKASRGGGLIGMIDSKAERKMAENQLFALQVKCRDMEQNIVELSGGNQQKVLLARQLAMGSHVVIFDEPTKGIDVGTKSEIYGLMRILVDNGIGVIVVSSELPEILAICDRILVFAEGEIRAEFTSEDATEEALVKAAAIGVDAHENGEVVQ